MKRVLPIRDMFDVLPRELIVDNFAGGGGASLGIEMALGRSPDIAVNHDPEAVGLHERNHPNTRHFCESVWDVDPATVCAGRPVGLAWFSPDCKHFSKAKGGRPVSKRVRGLAWVVVKWAKAVAPRVIVLENVEEFQTWGPLSADGRPCPVRKGRTFSRWVRKLQRLGYAVEWRLLRACDYGAPTTRRRLFLVARRDGAPIAWPAPTHGQGRLPYRTAAECIDWRLTCPSIFERARPLAEATLRRIAFGVQRYVLQNQTPFIVPIQNWSRDGTHAVSEPMRTITAKPDGGGFALVAPTLVTTGYGERAGQAPRVPGLDAPLGTVVGGQKHALVAAFIAKHYGGVVGHAADRPLDTITAVDHNSLVTSNLVKLRNNGIGQDARAPVGTITAGGQHFAEVRALLVKFYSSGGQWAGLDEPMHTIPTHDRMGLVTVHGEQYAIADIGLRMLQPRELFRAQSFPDSYVIDRTAAGVQLSKAAQIRMCGNSVPPAVACAVVAAQFRREEEALAA